MERDQLLKEVWEDDGVFVGRSLDVFISKLRKKLLQDDAIRISCTSPPAPLRGGEGGCFTLIGNGYRVRKL
jgi:hypothetical protein